MKNIAVIFAGGMGRRLDMDSRPKQFLELNGKPVVIYTIEQFENHPQIDGIIVACLEKWIPFLQKQLKLFNIDKVVRIVPGGETGQDSIFNGLEAAHRMYGDDEVNVLIHDGVRPLILEKTISDCVAMVEEMGSCITCAPMIENLIVKNDNETIDVPARNNSFIARAPQCFRLKDIYDAHIRARREGKHDFVDSCSMMCEYGYELNIVIGPVENIKITTPMDFFIFRALKQARENQMIFGV